MLILNVLYISMSSFSFLLHVLDFSGFVEERTGAVVNVPKYDAGKYQRLGNMKY
jgi:hypothetical protein